MKQPFSNFILQANAAKLFMKPTHEKAFNVKISKNNFLGLRKALWCAIQ